MKPFSLIIAILTFLFTVTCTSKSKNQNDHVPEITFHKDNNNKKIDIMSDGELFTSYRWQNNVCKPFLYPVNTVSGTSITRGYPLEPITGERIDHAHQTGMWLTYGNVDGYDFWGNGSKGLGTRNENGGIIKHLKIEKMSEGTGKASIFTSGSWIDPSRRELLKEQTEYHFMEKGKTRIIDRITTLTAGEKEVLMPDTKEGMFGIRVARQLELPSEREIIIYGKDGQPQKVKGSTDKSVSGNYLSSEGVTGPEVWGTRAKWMDLYGKIGKEDISLVICDHPKNPVYPTYWHARGYGLFSANPLGWNDFTKGDKQLNFSIPKENSVTFRFRVIIHSGSHLDPEQINHLAEDFSERY